MGAVAGRGSGIVIVYGVNPVLEALRAERVRTVRLVASSRKTAEIRRFAEESGIPVIRVSPAALDRIAGGAAHQGVAADVAPPPAATLEALIAGLPEPALLLVLDGIEDPGNLGAILRSAEAAGVDGVIRQKRRAAPLGQVEKASAGAASHVRIVSVVNIARALAELQATGVWAVGLEADGDDLYRDVDLTLPTAFVVGSEGRGLRRLVRERCDRVASIPMLGRVNSLNVAVAAGVALFEAVRQRRGLPARDRRPDVRTSPARARRRRVPN